VRNIWKNCGVIGTEQIQKTTDMNCKIENSTLGQGEVSCNCCGLFALCNAAGMESPDSPQFQQLVRRRMPLAKGKSLFHKGGKLRYLYAVKSGAIITQPNTGGNEAVSGFYLPGEVLGLEAIANDHYSQEATALVPTSICQLDLDRLDLLGEGEAQFNQGLLELMSLRLRQEQALFQLLGTNSTEQRLATFLVNYSDRLQRNGMPYLEFRLPMTRREIGDYLGLALETVSRMFHKLQDKGVLEVSGRKTRIRNLEKLKALAIRLCADLTTSPISLPMQA
jgi:CRP/FNR family transcriptional regulator